MEIKRETANSVLDALSDELPRLRAQLLARDMLRGELEDEDLERYIEQAVMMTTSRRRSAGRGQLDLPADLRARLLRDRDDVDRRRAPRHRALRVRGVPRLAAPGRPDHPLGPGQHQDGAGHPPDLRPDARAEVGDLDGRVLLVDGRVQQLRARPVGQVPADRRARPGLPAAARGARPRDPAPAREDPGQRQGRVARALRRGGDRGDSSRWPRGPTWRHPRVRPGSAGA